MMSRLIQVFAIGLMVVLSAVASAQSEPVRFEMSGVFHRPTPGNESKRFDIPMELGRTFDRLAVELDVKVGPWNARGEKTNHAVFWLNRGALWRSNLFGYVNIFGPTRPRVKMANNVFQERAVMLSRQTDWRAEPGHTYHFRYEYDAAKRSIVLTVSENGKTLTELRDVTSVGLIEADPLDHEATPGFFIVFGHPAESVGPEVPTYDWEYANLKLSFEPAVPAPERAAISEGVRGARGVITHHVRSPHQKGTTTINVLLPDDYDASNKYRVLYVLPVQAWDSPRHGSGLEQIIELDAHNAHDLICVFPTFSDWPWYADHPTDPGLRQVSYMTEDVVPFIDATYSTTRRAEDQLLLGFSKSGWGAFVLLLLRPDVFGKAAAWDSPLAWTEPSERAAPIFGTQENFERYSVLNLIRTRGRLLGERPRLFNFGCPGARGPHHTAIHELLNELNIPHKHTDGQPLEHAWASGWMPEAIEFLVAP